MTEGQSLAPEIVAHYELGMERDRLAAGAGRLELLRTQQVLRGWLPPPRAHVLDVGGGAGVHALWLTQDGYEVELFDPVPLHVSQAQAASVAQRSSFRTTQADARQLPAEPKSADVVLEMGPLYHLTDRTDRLAALVEAHRVLRPGGYLAVAAISRFADWTDGIWRDLFGRPGFREMAAESRATGQHRAAAEDWFTTSYFRAPDELAEECRDAGFVVDRVVAVEGIGFLLSDLDALLNDPERRERLLESLGALETEPSLIGASPHLLVLARKPKEIA